MSDKPPANPDDLTAAAKKFFAAAEELRRIGDLLTRRTQDLVNGSDAWAGSASEQFLSAWDRFGADTQNSANTLDRTANTLNRLAVSIQYVQTSPAGKLVRAIDAGHVRVVPNSVHSLVPGAGAVSTVSSSDAASAKTAVSDGYDHAAAVGASDFAAAADATASSAHLAGGANSAAVGISQAGWSAATLAAALESTTS
ncbi:MAG TPA: WXG100 family type VII secretion target, partial [Ktedonobacterales bacterium]|nr:WXG100 family type VII secretion target [Ktedonobacterales bacterium]